MNNVEFRQVTHPRFPFGEVNKKWVIDAQDAATVSVGYVAFGTSSSAVLTIYGSVDGAVLGTALDTLTGSTDETIALDASGWSYIVVKVTTAEADVYARITATLKA